MILPVALIASACLAAIAWAARQVLVHQRKRDLRSAYLDSRDEPAERVDEE